MPPQFQSLNELVGYLDALEQRVKTLENKVSTLQMENDSLNHYIKDLGGDAGKMLPKTGIISTSFLQRAFTIWGHNFVAQLIISIPITCIYFIVVFLILQQGMGNIAVP